MKTLTLNNGVVMPQLGIGTFLLAPNDAYNSVLNALKLGYRMIDTANIYLNEKSVGRAIKDSGIDRKEIFVSTKLWPTEYTNPNAVEETLKRLGLDYIDLLFIHQPTKNWEEGYKTLIKAYKEGKIKSIGVSNFEGKYIEKLLKEYDVIPQVMQCECHPFFAQDDTRIILNKHDIKLMAWYPLGGKDNMSILSNKIITTLSKKYNKSSAQIILRWHIQMGFIVIPGSKNIEHIKDNLNIFDFELSSDDIAKIDSLNNIGRIYHRSEEALKRFAHFEPKYED